MSAIGCCLDFVAATMFATAAGAIGASRCVRIKPDFFQGPLLYLAMVGQPGSAKSPVLKNVCRGLHEAEQRYAESHRERLKQFESEMVIYHQLLKQQGKKNACGTTPVKPTRPTQERIIINDATVEAIGRILNDQPRGVHMIRDELTAWVTSANQYKGGKGSDRQFWLSNWAGTPVSIDRVKQDIPLYVPHPHVSVFGGIQPDLIADLRDDNERSDGYMDRILFTFPDGEQIPEWTWNEIAEDAAKLWTSTVTTLLALEMEA